MIRCRQVSPALLTIAAAPTAVFRVPSTLSIRAAVPTAVFESAWLRTSVPAPAPVLKLPVKSLRERKPTECRVSSAGYDAEKGVGAVCRVERCRLPEPDLVSGVCAFGANASHTRMSGMRRNPRQNGSERAGSRPHETNLLT